MDKKITCEQIQKRIMKLIVITIILIITVPLVISWIYIAIEHIALVKTTEVSVSDYLEASCTVLSAIAAVILGWIAIKQNDRLTDIEKNRSAIETSCNIYIQPNNKSMNFIRLSNESGSESVIPEQDIYMEIANYSEAFLMEIDINADKWKFRSHITLAKGQDKYVVIGFPNNCENKRFNICFTSCYGVETFGDFEVKRNVNDQDTLKIVHYHFYGTQRPKEQDREAITLAER